MRETGGGERCTYCRRVMEARGTRGKLAATRDHIVPKQHGGGGTVWCCAHCNNLKANMMPQEWSAFMLLHPEWWRTFRFGLRTGDRARIRAHLIASASSTAPSE